MSTRRIVRKIEAMIFFVVGLITLVLFGKGNLQEKEQEMAENRNVKPGEVLTKPVRSSEKLSASPTGRPVPPTVISPMDVTLPPTSAVATVLEIALIKDAIIQVVRKIEQIANQDDWPFSEQKKAADKVMDTFMGKFDIRVRYPEGLDGD